MFEKPLSYAALVTNPKGHYLDMHTLHFHELALQMEYVSLFLFLSILSEKRFNFLGNIMGIDMVLLRHIAAVVPHTSPLCFEC